MLCWGRLSHRITQHPNLLLLLVPQALELLAPSLSQQHVWLAPGAGRQAGIAREAPTSYTVPWRPSGWVIQTVALLSAL